MIRTSSENKLTLKELPLVLSLAAIAKSLFLSTRSNTRKVISLNVEEMRHTHHFFDPRVAVPCSLADLNRIKH